MRRPIKKRPTVTKDERYDSLNVSRLINYIMLRGQKETARKVVYAAFEEIKPQNHWNDPQLNNMQDIPYLDNPYFLSHASQNLQLGDLSLIGVA